MYTAYNYLQMSQFQFPAKITSNGRVTIPKRFRDMYDMEEGDLVQVEVDVDE